MKFNLKPCPYCGGIAEGYIKTVESFKKIHNYYVECTECGASTERYTTEFAMLRGGHFHAGGWTSALPERKPERNNPEDTGREI